MVCLRSASSLGLGVALLSPTACVAGFTSAHCKREGYEYVEGDKLSNAPLGGFWHTPVFCQKSCQANVYCEQWTWKESGVHGSVYIAPGGCWVFSKNAVLEKVNMSTTRGRVTSGPKNCLEVAVPPNATMIPPLPATTTTTLPVATEPPTTTTTTTATSGQPAVTTDAEGGGYPWWIGPLVAGVIGLVAVLVWLNCREGGLSGSKSTKKKSSRSAKVPKTNRERLPVEAPQVEASEAAPLVQSQALALPSAAAPAATQPQGFPQITGGPPQAGMAAQGYPAGAQYMQPQPGAFQMASITPYMQPGARQPQFAAMP